MFFESNLDYIVSTQLQFEQEGIVHHTTADRTLSISNISNKIPYFVMDRPHRAVPELARDFGRIVVPFVVMDSGGRLNDSTPRLYGVNPHVTSENSQLAGNEFAVNWLQQLHVIAEDLALKYGVLREYGRVSAEVAIYSQLKYAQRGDYLPARIRHLYGVEEAINRTTESDHKKQIAREGVQRAISALEEY